MIGDFPSSPENPEAVTKISRPTPAMACRILFFIRCRLPFLAEFKARASGDSQVLPPYAPSCGVRMQVDGESTKDCH